MNTAAAAAYVLPRPSVGSARPRPLQEFLYTDPALALEYYMLAAEAMGGSVQVVWGGGGGP